MPVQPVACRMRWANMDPAWVNDGPTQYVVLLRLMAQVTNYVRGQWLGHGVQWLDHGVQWLGHGVQWLGHGMQWLGHGMQRRGHGMQ